MELEALSHKEYLKLNKDYSKAATVADMVYVSDKDPGISRRKKGTGFSYTYKQLVLMQEIESNTVIISCGTPYETKQNFITYMNLVNYCHYFVKSLI